MTCLFDVLEKDWTGNSMAIFSTHGASNHSDKDRAESDYYATSPKAVEILLEYERFYQNIWEPAVGGGHIAEVLKDRGYTVRCSDIVDRGYGGTEMLDFLSVSEPWEGDIITNPPYSHAKEFVEKSLELIPPGYKVAMFLKLTFLEGSGRKPMFKNTPPRWIYVFSSRIGCARNGNEEDFKGGAVAYAWYVWVKGFKGMPQVLWVN